MGLLNRLEKTGIDYNSIPVSSEPKEQIQKPNSVGLLKKSILLSNKSSMDFFEFKQTYNFSHIAVFNCIENTFYISESFGFDFESIQKSLSTANFWEGTISQKNKWLYFSNLALAPFYQFFSDKLKEKIKSMHIFFSQKNYILMICSEDLPYKEQPESIITDFENLNTSNEDCNITAIPSFTFSLSTNFDKILAGISDIKLKDPIKKSLIEALKGVLLNNFQKNEFSITETDINFYFKLEEFSNIELLKHHICQIIFETTGSLLNSNTPQNTKDDFEFMQVE